MNIVGNQRLPNHFSRLSNHDKQEYLSMMRLLSSEVNRNQRKKSKGNFEKLINRLKSFIVRDDADDRIRMLVCGICWLEKDTIATNTQQLHFLLSKTKNSINGSFNDIGYKWDPTYDTSKLFPEQPKQWIIRRLKTKPQRQQEIDISPPSTFEGIQSGMSISAQENTSNSQEMLFEDDDISTCIWSLESTMDNGSE